MNKEPQEASSTLPVLEEPPPFSPPRHWLGPEELDPSYWGDPQNQQKRGQEFYEKPVEWLEQVDRLDQQGIARRDFLTVMGASMAMAAVSCVRRPVHKIIPHVVQPEEITPGVPVWYASTCLECPSRCGVLVKNLEGRPIKLEGNPDHPINRGKLCARGQASLLSLYDPDRLKLPVAHLRAAKGVRQEITWDVADAAIQVELKKIASQGGGRIRILSHAIQSKSTLRLMDEFLSAFPEGQHIEFEPLGTEELVQAQGLSYDRPEMPAYRLDRAEFVLSLGADFLGTWISPVEFSQDWIENRKIFNQKSSATARMSRLVCFESHLSLTGANADLRHPIRPGDELKIALALIHELVTHSGVSVQAFPEFQNSMLASSLANHSVAVVAAELGMDPKILRQVAMELGSHRSKSLVLAGGLSSQTTTALELQVAVNVLNSLLENEGFTVGRSSGQSEPPLRGGVSALQQLAADLREGKIDAVLFYRTNPAYFLPQWDWGTLLKRVSCVISVSDREDETGLLADYILPDPHFLENWGDSQVRPGVYSLQQPVLAPLHSTRSLQDSLLRWSQNIGLRVSGLAARSKDWHQYLKSHWEEKIYPKAGTVSSFHLFWEAALRKGVYLEGEALQRASLQKRSLKKGILPSLLASATPSPSSGILLALYSKVSLGDGKSANNAWLQELPDPISSMTWDNYLNVSPQLAREKNLKENEVVRLQGDAGGGVELPVHIQPGLHPGVVTAAVGYGRQAAGKVGNGAGVSVYPFSQIKGGRLIYSGQTVTFQKTGRIYPLASTQWHTATEHRPIINDITLSEYKKNPAAEMHVDPHLRLKTVPTLWPEHTYPGYRWGMTIDLTSCTGCSACVIACQAENNIPVVGRDQVRKSRQMHWIRIDRYYSGSPQNPEVVFQPMLCQHCENAPCETVCPVLATVHDNEGLNVQVYNRCVGTRYCQNNCPYKVRRFNFFDHWKSYDQNLNLVWNPDVTVRSRGIMEKCTFCIQRIRGAKDKAKDEGRKVKDGEFQTACQQTCPTQAITFGNVNDPQSQVSQQRNSPAAFRVLEVLNTKPMVSYMTKVRNHSGESGGHTHV